MLAPHYSGFSVGQYQARLADGGDARGVPCVAIDSWHLEPAYLDFLAAAVRDALAPLPERTKVLFTAHSLPERVLVDDPYPDQLRASAAAVAEAVGLDRWAGWSLCWQSAGRTPEPWRGPDVLEVIRDLAATGRADGVLVCPQGFVSDHLEVVYDLDIEAAQVAAEVGLAFARTRVLNDDPAVLGRAGRPRPRRGAVTDVVVVGGGITGLVAARDAAHRRAPTVTLVEPGPARRQGAVQRLRRRRARRGGRRLPRPGARGVDLCRALGHRGRPRLAGRRDGPTCGAGARCACLPEAQVLGVPTDLDELAASEILSRRRAAPRRRRPHHPADRAGRRRHASAR